MHSIRIIGPGRAGTSLAAALSAHGEFAGFCARGDHLARAARGVDVLVIATPDDAIAEVAAAVEPLAGTTVAHLSGSLGSTPWRHTRSGRRSTRSCPCPTERSARPDWARV